MKRATFGRQKAKSIPPHPTIKRRTAFWPAVDPVPWLQLRVEWNPAARQEALKVELWQTRKNRRLAKGQMFPLEKGQRQFCL